jgi:hypothetical protein
LLPAICNSEKIGIEYKFFRLLAVTQIGFVKTAIGALIFKGYAQLVYGLSFRIALGDDEANLYRFRYKIYCDEGYIKSDSYPDQKFSDKYDPASISVIAVKANEIVGAGRATHYSQGGLPTFEYFNIKLPDNINRDRIVEMGRFMVHPKHRGKARLVAIGMSLQLKKYVRGNPDIEWLVAFMSDKVQQAFAALIPFQTLAENPLAEIHIQARGLLPGYWEKGNIHPVIAKASELL